jgi:hypothetical protein
MFAGREAFLDPSKICFNDPQLKAMSGGEITASRRLNRKGVLIRKKESIVSIKNIKQLLKAGKSFI